MKHTRQSGAHTPRKGCAISTIDQVVLIVPRCYAEYGGSSCGANLRFWRKDNSCPSLWHFQGNPQARHGGQEVDALCDIDMTLMVEH